MAMVCDACGTKFSRDNGQSSLHVTPPRVDFRMIEALARAGLPPYEQPDFMQLDLCIQCTSKALTHLGLPTKICELPVLPTEAAESDGNAGALTADDLRQLGLDPNMP
jgi:hypothetical protein